MDTKPPATKAGGFSLFSYIMDISKDLQVPIFVSL